MDPGPVRDVLGVALGIATGVLSGLFGVGGGVISQPGMRLLGLAPLVAIGTALPTIIPSAASGTARYAREQLIAWRAVRWTVPLGVAAAVGGSLLSKEVPGEGHLLQLVTAGLLAFSAWRMFSGGGKGGDTGTGDGVDDSVAATPGGRLAAIGVLSGLLSGLLGIGGGVIMVPAFTQLAGMRVKAAIATSLVCVGAFAIPGTATHAALGDVDWRMCLALVLGVVPGARLGASLAIRATDRRLRLVVSTFLMLTAVLYGAGELRALLD